MGRTMNYLAHLYFARPTPASRVGNLLGDFRRGIPVSDFPPAVRAGLHNHLCVDAFTDSHAAVRSAKQCFSRPRRRFAGVALDVLFDHFLIRHWRRFSDTDLDAFIDACYRDLASGRELMPAPMRRQTRRMAEYDWLRAYARMDNVGLALERMATRIRFRNDFAAIMEEIEPRESELEALFLRFFPALCRHVQERDMEGTQQCRDCIRSL